MTESEKSQQSPEEIVYRPTPTGLLFHASSSRVRAIMGPTGGGKSSMCCNELYFRALSQAPDKNGIRRTRFAIIRNTHNVLEMTTIKTWVEWIPESLPDGTPYCVLNRQRPITGKLKLLGNDKLGDGTHIDMELHFLALDKEDDIKKLKSLELTGCWINECSEVPKAVWDMAFNRCDRFPPKRMGGCTWSGLIMDTNPPDEDSDFYNVFEIMKPEGYVLFKQPPAIFLKASKDKDAPPEYEPNYGQRPGIPKCENVENHNSGYDYWMRQVHGKDPYWIKVFMQGEYGVTRIGKPVFENQYSDSFHCATKDLLPYRGLPLLVGMDYAHCAIVIGQLSPRGQLMILDELFADFMGVKQFANRFMLPLLRKDYANMPFKIIGDPSGNQRAMTDEVTCMMELTQLGIQVEPARSNLLMPRLNAIRNLLTQNLGGEPKLIISPRCKQLRAAFQAKYVYRKSHTSLGTSYSEEPDKSHPWSDLCDALSYIAMDVTGIGSYGKRTNEVQSGRRERIPDSAPSIFSNPTI